jgi:hypothetical protein
MASQINNRQLGLILVTGLGILFALFAGNYVAEEDYTPIAAVLGGLMVLVAFFGLGSSGNLIIPICFGLTGQISLLPLPFSVRQLAVVLASGVFISGLIFKSRMKNASVESVDYLAWFNIVWLGIVFFRNPVGINALGTNLVGGKPYVDFTLGVMSYVILSRQEVTPKQARFIVLGTVWLSIFVSVIATIVFFKPELGAFLGKFYSEFGSFGIAENQIVEVGETRLGALQGSGMTLITYCACMVNPMSMIAPGKWKYLGLYIMGFLMVMLSGFRSAFFNAILITGLSCMLRDRIEGLAKIVFSISVLGSVFILLSYTNIQLPHTFQRALSFLPGNWDSHAIQAGEDSNEWRFDMWRTVMTSDRYIRNKLLGDGYGFLRSEYDQMIDAAHGVGYLAGSEGNKEAHMIQGTYHSGPISTIKRVGYIGLVALLMLMIKTAAYALSIIRKSVGTPFQLIALFYGLPIIILPILFIFIFGDYNDITTVLFSLGMFKMISASLEAYHGESRFSGA